MEFPTGVFNFRAEKNNAIKSQGGYHALSHIFCILSYLQNPTLKNELIINDFLFLLPLNFILF